MQERIPDQTEIAVRVLRLFFASVVVPPCPVVLVRAAVEVCLEPRHYLSAGRHLEPGPARLAEQQPLRVPKVARRQVDQQSHELRKL